MTRYNIASDPYAAHAHYCRCVSADLWPSAVCGPRAALGGRIRYLVDTPEVIWGCLDTGRLLDGAVRLLRAREVHRRLRTERQGAEVAARFPLLVPLWPGVEKFRRGLRFPVL